MSSLVTLIALAFGLLIGLLMLTWLTLTARERARRIDQSRPPERPTRTRPDVSNDVVRGAHASHERQDLPPAAPDRLAPREESRAERATRERAGSVQVRDAGEERAQRGEDPFERFLDAGRRQREDFDR
ncbi:MAG: hypothetical protein U5K81_10605 [Trueperaceae bacterium]|nr:hypothetical protein [Trueperaceae bacterium]